MGTWFLIVVMISPMGEIQTSIYNPTEYKSNSQESCHSNGDRLITKIKERFGENILVSYTCTNVAYEDIIKSLPPSI